MTVGEGKFLLYSHITPALKAGDYRFDVSQRLGARRGTEMLDAGDLDVDTLNTHIRVDAPRYRLPPDQVLSTYPPAGTEGSYGKRLPQIVIKRRTLPWERGLTMPGAGAGAGAGQVDVDEKTPWLALVLIAEGEAELRLNTDVAACVTAGVTLGGAADVAKANCLVARKSIVEKVFPTRKDVPLLAHAREVDVNDTELMMGDDDGYLSVVIANRLPVAGRAADGTSTPVKYLACLINLEGQFHRLIPQAPAPNPFTHVFGQLHDVFVDEAVFDHVASGGLIEHWSDPVINPTGTVFDVQLAGGVAGPLAEMSGESDIGTIKAIKTTSQAYAGTKGFGAGQADVYVEMAKGFGATKFLLAEPEYTFPVLLHWSFVSTGDVDFEKLMESLDSGLLGTVPVSTDEPEGRPPLEVVETGHVRLTHRTRRGDVVPAWYRGPLLPHPSNGERLPIAHASDQLRAVIPDGTEDISLATAFEIGRLLALSRPAMVAALMRWRQTHFQAARSRAIWDGIKDFLPFDDLDLTDIRRVLDGRLRELIAFDPDQLIGPPRELIGPGDPIDWGGQPLDLLGRGYGIDADLAGDLRHFSDLGSVVLKLRDLTPPVRHFDDIRLDDDLLHGALHGVLDQVVEQLTSNVLANEIRLDPAFGATVVRTPDIGTVLDREGNGILDIPGGILAAAGEGPRRRPRKQTIRPDALPAEPDPIDQLLGRRRSTRPRPSTPGEENR